MAKTNLFLCWLLFICQTGFAQQNLFNVPSSEITAAKKAFFQQQSNLTAEDWQFVSTVSYGLGRKTEIGLNVYGIRLNPRLRDSVLLTNGNLREGALYPALLLNAQKAFRLTEILQTSLGTQTGLNLGADKRLLSYNYLNVTAQLEQTQTRLIAGLHTFNKAFVGDRNGSEQTDAANNWFAGFHLGVQQSIIRDKLELTADFISGKHELGESAWGLDYHLTKTWVLSAAYQLPNPQSAVQPGVIIGLTYVPEE